MNQVTNLELSKRESFHATSNSMCKFDIEITKQLIDKVTNPKNLEVPEIETFKPRSTLNTIKKSNSNSQIKIEISKRQLIRRENILKMQRLQSDCHRLKSLYVMTSHKISNLKVKNSNNLLKYVLLKSLHKNIEQVMAIKEIRCRQIQENIVCR
ncbi:hypothetical protein A3Q56_07671 [Intoshia linei]|uniref:Uncharacterized protein n=1 Tax=Intoshia linei TaxID=1819745 RepID=A0A177ARH8_9BILA|nr:hypothetical protein A3Q56_07671 [Intoshia linei]